MLNSNIVNLGTGLHTVKGLFFCDAHLSASLPKVNMILCTRRGDVPLLPRW